MNQGPSEISLVGDPGQSAKVTKIMPYILLRQWLMHYGSSQRAFLKLGQNSAVDLKCKY